MSWNSFLVLLVGVFVAGGCRKADSTSPSPVLTPPPGTTQSGPTKPNDLAAYGIPGMIDLPSGFEITQQEASQVVIDRDNGADDPFELRILPYMPINGTMQEHKKSVLENGPYEFIYDEVEGFAAFLKSDHPHPMSDHKIEVYREVMLGNRKFVACSYIADYRANKQLLERVWKAAKSLRPK